MKQILIRHKEHEDNKAKVVSRSIVMLGILINPTLFLN